MRVGKALHPRSSASIDSVSAAAIPIAVAPFGYLLGNLFVVHLVPSVVQAVWLSTVVLTVIALLGYGLLSEPGR